MKKIVHFVLLFSFLVMATLAYSQTTFKISGRVFALAKPVEGASVSLLAVKDSSLIAMAVTNFKALPAVIIG